MIVVAGVRSVAQEDRLGLLRAEIAVRGLDGLVVPRTDAYQSEITAPHDDCLRYLTGFTGSAGVVVVMAHRAVIFVDGRYQVQVRREVDMGLYDVEHLHDAPPETWLRANVRAPMRIGVDPMRVNHAFFGRLAAACADAGAELVALSSDPFEAIWPDRPPPPLGPVRWVPDERVGERAAEKQARIAEGLRRAGADFLVETQPDNIAWLLNVRGSDVPMNPVPHSFLVLRNDGRTEWFVDRRKLGNERMPGLEEITVSEPQAFLPRLGDLAAGSVALIDPDFVPAGVGQAVVQAGGRLVEATDPVTVAKARKNAVELQGFRDCHVEDGIAQVEFLAWLSGAVANGPVRELEAEARLHDFRATRPGFLEESFRTISAAGPNAALCHYASAPETDIEIGPDAPYLVDSGGQYETGTTDATRTVIFGPASAPVRAAYTAVLKGFVGLCSARFPQGTCGHQLDALARLPLWAIGLDYDHGTGHSVGHNLLVHEYPHRFAKKANPHGLVPGNIMTIEPGYYEAGAFGIRIENEVEVVAAGPGFCRFEALTLVPIDLGPVDHAALSPAEVAWIDDYHRRVWDRLGQLVSAEARDWLREVTRPVGG